MSDPVREAGRIFQHYFGNLNKLDEKNEQFYKDVQALALYSYKIGHLSGLAKIKEYAKEYFDQMVCDKLTDNIVERTRETNQYIEETKHLKRDEK